MRKHPLGTVGLTLVALWLGQHMGVEDFAVLAFGVPAFAREKTQPAPIGYGGPRIRLLPIMAPFYADGGVRYQPLTIEVELAGGGVGGESLSEKGNARQKQACFIIPMVHERLLMFLFEAHLESADFTGDRAEVLSKKLFDAVIDLVGRGYFTNLTLLPDDAPALDPTSETLSKQCH